MNENVIIIGAGGHGKVIADMVSCAGDRVLGFLDDGKAGTQVLGPVSDYVKYPEAAFIVAIGSADARRRVVQQLKNVRWYTAIHPKATVSAADVTVGEGTAVMAGAVINPGAKIGRHCIVNTGAIVEHDNRIGDFAHISVGAKLAGTVTVGENTWIGIGAVVSNNVSVCHDCLIGAGAVVVRSIEEPGTYAGVPARKIK